MEDGLRDYIHFLTVEKGLAKNTLISYERDLKSYMKMLQKVEQISSWNDVRRINIINFLSHIKEQGKSSKTIARHIASIRSFHQFLLRDKQTEQDPHSPPPLWSVPRPLPQRGHRSDGYQRYQ